MTMADQNQLDHIYMRALGGKKSCRIAQLIYKKIPTDFTDDFRISSKIKVFSFFFFLFPCDYTLVMRNPRCGETSAQKSDYLPEQLKRTKPLFNSYSLNRFHNKRRFSQTGSKVDHSKVSSAELTADHIQNLMNCLSRRSILIKNN